MNLYSVLLHIQPFVDIPIYYLYVLVLWFFGEATHCLVSLFGGYHSEH